MPFLNQQPSDRLLLSDLPEMHLILGTYQDLHESMSDAF